MDPTNTKAAEFRASEIRRLLAILSNSPDPNEKRDTLAILVNLAPKIFIRALRLLEANLVKVHQYEDRKLVTIHDVDSWAEDNDSDNEFIHEFENHKTVYKRRERRRQYVASQKPWDPIKERDHGLSRDSGVHYVDLVVFWDVPFCSCSHFQVSGECSHLMAVQMIQTGYPVTIEKCDRSQWIRLFRLPVADL